MSATSTALRAYATGQGAIQTPRSIEFQVFAKITHRIKRAVQTENQRELIDAMHENRKLWTALALDVASPGNALPAELRAKLFYLAEFTQQHTSKVLAKDATAVPLIEINAAILHGLQTEGTNQ